MTSLCYYVDRLADCHLRHFDVCSICYLSCLFVYLHLLVCKLYIYNASLSSFFQFLTGGHLREFTDEESNFAALLQRAMDLEGIDRDVVHHLVALLMKVRTALPSIGTVKFAWLTFFLFLELPDDESGILHHPQCL